MNPRQSVAQVLRLFPVVTGGRVAVLMVAEVFLLVLVIVGCFAEGLPASDVVFASMILPAVLLIAVGTSDVVPGLRAAGELELAVTLASPARVILHRFAPVVVVAALQIVPVGVVMLFLIEPWQVPVGWLVSLLPLAFVVVSSLYWNLRLRGAGAILGASLATLVPALLWINSCELFPDSDNLMSMTLTEVLLSAARCQLGLLFATACMGALARRRLSRTEELLDG